MKRAPHFNDASVAARIHQERLRFTAGIADGDVLRLASSHHPAKKACTLFQSTLYGSYNVCYFVEFEGTGERWTVRVPIRPCLTHRGRSKLASEVTTMKYLESHTDIPVPKVRAYSLDGDDDRPLSSYLIVDYVGGTQLSSINLQQLDKDKTAALYASLAKVLLKLRRMTFFSFGRLQLLGGVDLHVASDIVTRDINTQELEGLDPRCIQHQCYGQRGLLPTATHYTETLIRTAYNAFFKGTDSVDPDMIDSGLYHLDLFRQYASMWLDPKISHLQFCLTHGDFAPHNIFVDANTMEVTGIIDWGWSRVVPIQYFIPPLWLRHADFADVAWKHAYDGYLSQEFNEFLAAVRAEERKKYKHELLAEQWERTKHDGGFLIAHALENWNDIDVVAFRYLNGRYYGGTADLEGRMARFLEDDPLRGLVVEMKERQAKGDDVYGAEQDRKKHSKGVVSKLWPGTSALQGSMMLITTGVGYGLYRLALASARRPPRI